MTIKTRKKFHCKGLHFPLPLVQAPPVQTLKLLLLFHSGLVLSAAAAEDGKIIGGLCPVSADSIIKQMLIL